MFTFLNRSNEIMRISIPDRQPSLISIFGEAGIGKTSLLLEAGKRFLERFSLGLLLFIDLADLAEVDPGARPDFFVRALVKTAGGRLGSMISYSEVPDKAMARVASQLIDLSHEMPVLIMFDTSEKLQEDTEFWHWIEAQLVSPLAVEGKIRQVFAGRIPITWRRIEVRRIVALLHLPPLSTAEVGKEVTSLGDTGAAEALVQEALYKGNQGLERAGKEVMVLLIELILDLSFGHPLLSRELAEYAAEHWRATDSVDGFRRDLSTHVVKEFIDHKLFEGIEYPWDKILWWVSVLDWFDATLIQRYLLMTDPDLVAGKPDYFFIQGISSLRKHHTVLWREAQGDQLQGTIANIVRRCMEISRPESYRIGCLAAADTFAQLAQEFEMGSLERDQYEQESEKYLVRTQQEVNP